jgi:hypothetical protein
VSRHITVAVPAYAGTVHLLTLRALLHDLVALAGRGDRFSLIDYCGSAIIADTRAEICAQFLESESTDLVFVDHDVAWKEGSLLRLIDHPVDMVAGSYPFRRDPIVFPIRYIKEREELWADPETGLLEVAGVPGGFLRVTRNALLQMTGAHPELSYDCHKMDGKPVVGLFEPYRIGRTKLSEDYSFCQRWRDLGGKVWVDPMISMSHTGNKTFAGCLGDWLRARDE